MLLPVLEEVELTAEGDGADEALETVPALCGAHDDPSGFDPSHHPLASLRSPSLRSLSRDWHLWRTLTAQELAARYRGTLLGRLWPVLLPLVMFATYAFVFGVIFQARWGGSGDTKSFALVLFSGLVLFLFASECINRAPMLILLAILVLYLAMGCVMDSMSMLLLTIPIFYPIIAGLDFGMNREDTLIWFGILAVVVVEVGLITPPVGMNVFVVNGMARDVPMWESFKGVMPFLISDIIRIGFLIAFPVVTLGLVRALG